MKKETIFRHEINESIQANAAMNCLKNRNKQQLNEFHPAGMARIALPLLKPVIRKIVANLVSKMGAKAITGSRLIHTVMSKLNAGTIAKVAQKIGQTWTEVPEELKQEIWDFAAHTFKELLEKENAQSQPATQEQEEGADEKGAFALKLVKKFKNRMTPDYAKRPEMFMMLKLQNALKKPLMSLSKEEYRAWAKAICDACDSVFGASQEQEEDYGMNDLRAWRNSLSFNGTGEVDDTNYDDSVGIDMIADLLVADNKIKMEEKESVKPRIKELLDEHGLWIGEDEHEAERFISLYWDNQEQEESTYNEKEAIAKQVMANYNPDTDEYEDPMVWLRYAIQEHIGKQFLYLPKKEVKAWQKAIEATIDEYEFEKQHPAHYEHPEDADRLQSQLANAWDEGMEDDEDDYVPYNNTFDETHHDIVDNLISAVEYYFDTDYDVSGFNHYDYTEDQLGKAVEKVLDKYGDFPSSNNFDKCYAWTKKHVEELMKILETGSLENPYEGHPEFDF